MSGTSRENPTRDDLLDIAKNELNDNPEISIIDMDSILKTSSKTLYSKALNDLEPNTFSFGKCEEGLSLVFSNYAMPTHLWHLNSSPSLAWTSSGVHSLDSI